MFSNTHIVHRVQLSWDTAQSPLLSRWRLKSPASPLFTQPFIQEQIKENIKAPRHLRLQMASNAENASIWWRHHGHYISIAWGKSVPPSLCRFWSLIFFDLINYIPQNRCMFCVVLYVVKLFVSVFVRLGNAFNQIPLDDFTVTNSIACASDVTLKDICKINGYLTTSRHKNAKSVHSLGGVPHF